MILRLYNCLDFRSSTILSYYQTVVSSLLFILHWNTNKSCYLSNNLFEEFFINTKKTQNTQKQKIWYIQHMYSNSNIPDRASSWPTSPVAGTMQCLLSSGHNGGLHNLTCILGLNHYKDNFIRIPLNNFWSVIRKASR